MLLMHRTRNEKEFWVFPGGGKEDNETVEEAVVREIKEEASIVCNVLQLLYTHIYPDLGHKQFYYLCKHVSGNPKLGNYNEFQTMKEENQTYHPEWVSIDKLPSLLLYPLEIRDWLIKDYDNNFENTPRTATLKSTCLRQQI